MDPETLRRLGITEEQIREMMGLGELAEKSRIAEKQLEMAQALRQAQTSEGRFAGKTYVAADPMEHIATAVNQVRGAYDQSQALKEQKRIAAEQARIRAEYLKALMRGQSPTGSVPTSPGAGSSAPLTWGPPRKTAAQLFPLPPVGGR